MEQQYYPYPPFGQQPQQQQQYNGLPYAAPPAQQQQYYAQAPQGATRQPTLAPAPPRRQQEDPPSSPENGPGAPPPHGPDSPSISQYGEDLASQLARTNGGHDDAEDMLPTAHDESGEPIFHLPPPPEATYATEKALEDAIHSWSLEHGYELVRRASKKNAKGVLYKRYYHCSKHGKAANTGKLTDETRIRVNRKSQRMNCPMSLAIVALDPMAPEGEWQVRHRKTHHNHGPLDALALAGHRRRARAGGIEQAVDGLFAIGTPTAQVLQFLQRTNPNGLFTRTDVANMKLKYKKYGTCLDRKDAAALEASTMACNACRSRKVKCDNVRPTCGTCAASGIGCEYDSIEGADASQMDGIDEEPLNGDGSGQVLQRQPAQLETTQHTAETPRTGHVSAFQQNAQRAEEILANLQAFQTQHVIPVRLDLQSSSVEVLAASSCGSGDSYRNVPTLQTSNDWIHYRDSMTEACMKENTFEVLIGAKTEPSPPPAGPESKVEDWNEYIKQLAIYNRRNTALTGALWGTLAPHFRNRVQHLKTASEIWQVLEEACLPRGSDTGFRLYNDLHSITHANSADLKDYIIRLENAYVAFNRMSHHWRSQLDNHARAHPEKTTQPSRDPLAPTGKDNVFSTVHSTHPASKLPAVQPVFSEDMLCFLFLRGLGAGEGIERRAWEHWVDRLVGTNNVAGFGTGPRLGFVDLTKRAVEWEIGQRRINQGLV